MSLLKRALDGASTRSTLANPSEDLIAALGGQPSYSGKVVTVANALTLIPVFRAVDLISGAIGALPLEVFRHAADGTKSKASLTSRPWSLLHDRPNDLMAADELWQLVESHLLTWGNAYLWKERGPDGRVANLWAIDPRRVLVGRSTDAKPVFLVQTYTSTPPGQDYFTDGPSVVVGDEDILHIRGLGYDGLIGYSPIQLGRQRLGAIMAREEYGGRFWANDATPGVTLIHPGKLTPEAVELLRSRWDNRHKGPNRARATAVLAEAMTVEQMSVDMQEAQFIEVSKEDRTEIALLFGLPAHMLAGDSGGSMDYANTEQHSLDFVKWTARKWMRRIEMAVTWDPDIMPQNWYAKFNADEILRGSMAERYTAYGIGPHLLVDEVRAMEDLDPLPDGKGQVLAKTIGPPRGTAVAVQDEPLGDQPTPGADAEPLDTTTAPAEPDPTKKK